MWETKPPQAALVYRNVTLNQLSYVARARFWLLCWPFLLLSLLMFSFMGLTVSPFPQKKMLKHQTLVPEMYVTLFGNSIIADVLG